LIKLSTCLFQGGMKENDSEMCRIRIVDGTTNKVDLVLKRHMKNEKQKHLQELLDQMNET
jgi:translation initiation factor 2 alpha subunit (eIF-2alpha)